MIDPSSLMSIEAVTAELDRLGDNYDPSTATLEDCRNLFYASKALHVRRQQLIANTN